MQTTLLSAGESPQGAVAARRLHWPAVAVIALITAGDLEIRRRDVTAALDSSIDFIVLAELAAFGAVGLYLFLTVALPPRRRRLPRIMVATWTLVSLLAASALWAPSPALALVRSIQLLITMALVTALARRAGERDLALVAHGYVLVVTSWIGVGIFMRSPPDNAAGRFAWLYTHPVVAGSLLVISIVILASWSTRSGGPRFLSLMTSRVLLIVHGAALMATQTRGAAIAVGAGLAALVWLRMSGRRRVDAMILVGVGSPLIFAFATPVVTRFLLRGGSFEQLRTLNSRTELWSDAAAEIAESPLFGRGYFAARELFLDSIGLGGAHNAYVEIAVSAGLFGMAAFLWVVGSTTLELWRLRDHRQQPLLAALFVAALVNAISAGYLAQAGTGANVMFLVTIGWIAALSPPRSDPSASPTTPAVRRR